MVRTPAPITRPTHANQKTQHATTRQQNTTQRNATQRNATTQAKTQHAGVPYQITVTPEAGSVGKTAKGLEYNLFCANAVVQAIDQVLLPKL